MRLLVDMNLSPSWIGFLRDSGLEAEHWSQVGSPDAPDSEVMSYAAAHGYMVLTHDLDFGSILAVTRGEGPSVVQIRTHDVSVESFGQRVIAALRHLSSELEQGALLTIEADRTRIRRLPFRSSS